MTCRKFPTGKVYEKLSRHFSFGKKKGGANASDTLQNLQSMLWESPASLGPHTILDVSETHTQNS